MNNTNAANNVVGALQLTVAITDWYYEDVDQDGITKLKMVDESSTNVCIKRTIEFPNMKWRRQLKMNNCIHLHGRPFLLARPGVKTKFNPRLNILMIDTPKKICRPKVKNQYIPLNYSDDMENGLFDYTHYC